MGSRNEDVDPAIDPNMAPAGLTEALGRLYLWSGPANLLSIGTTSAPLEPEVLPWANNQALDAYKDFSRFVDDKGDKRPDIRDFISRCAETAIRLATIRAAGRWGRGATVDLSDMEWGAGIVWTAAQSMASGIQGYTPESDRSKGIARMAAWLRKKHAEGGRPVTKKEMQVHEGGNVKAAEFRERFEHMVLAGIIKPEGNGFVPGEPAVGEW
jgi:hypothetical protein